MTPLGSSGAGAKGPRAALPMSCLRSRQLTQRGSRRCRRNASPGLRTALASRPVPPARLFRLQGYVRRGLMVLVAGVRPLTPKEQTRQKPRAATMTPALLYRAALLGALTCPVVALADRPP